MIDKNKSDKQIQEEIESLISGLEGQSFQENEVIKKYPQIQLKFSELQVRYSKRISNRALRISLFGVVISGLALFFSLRDSGESSKWNEDQIKELKELNSNAVVNTKEMKNIIDELKATNQILDVKLDSLLKQQHTAR